MKTDNHHNIKNNINTITINHNNNVCEQDGEKGGTSPRRTARARPQSRAKVTCQTGNTIININNI